MKIFLAVWISFLLSTTVAASQMCGTYLGEKPAVSLEQAFPIAVREAHAKVPDLDKMFALQSIGPRDLKGDSKGQHWQFFWQEVPFHSRLRGVVVRVYMRDGSTSVKEIEEPFRLSLPAR